MREKSCFGCLYRYTRCLLSLEDTDECEIDVAPELQGPRVFCGLTRRNLTQSLPAARAGVIAGWPAFRGHADVTVAIGGAESATGGFHCSVRGRFWLDKWFGRRVSGTDVRGHGHVPGQLLKNATDPRASVLRRRRIARPFTGGLWVDLR